MNKSTFFAVLISLCFGIAIGGLLFFSSNNYFIATIKNTTVSLNEKQTEIYDRIQKNPANISSIIVWYHPESKNKELLNFQIDDDIFIFIQKLKSVENNKIAWDDGNDHGVLAANGHNITGLIYYKGKTYSFIPIGDGLHVISQINQAMNSNE